MPECLTPFAAKSNNGDEAMVPCGKCPACVARRVSSWSFRLMQEDKVSSISAFITLTYDTGHVPITRNGFMELKKRDLQLFFKRLRKAKCSSSTYDGKRIKYYAVGEYGGRTQRPHYHLLLFNCQLEIIQEAWNKGQVHYGLVSEASVGYTLKYMAKPGKIPMHRNDDRQPEFSLMSKRLGANYVTDAIKAWHHADPERMYCTLPDGKKISMPRYYKDRIYDEYQRSMFGKAAYDRMINEQNKEIQKLGIQEFERKKESAKAAMFKKSIKKSNQRDKL